MNLKDYNAGRKITGGTNAFESKIEELHEVYSQVSEYEHHKVATTILVNTLKSKADEYEAKAKAYNDTLETLDKLINNDERYKEARSNDFIAGMLIAYENIFNLMEDYIKEGCE